MTLAWRDSRTVRRRLLLFMSSISVGVAALVAIDSYSANVTRSIREQSRALLGADLALSSRQPFSSSVETLLDSLPRAGTPVARVTTFASMAFVPRTEGTRLVQVRAVEAGYPFYGVIETNPAGRWRSLHEGRNAFVDASLLIGLGARVGDSLSIGYGRFEIRGTLANVPGDIGVAAALGPRVFIPAGYLHETRLLGFGSRAEYEALIRLSSDVDPRKFARGFRARFDSSRVRSRTVQDTERNLTEGVAQLHRFLGIVGLVALLLGGIGVASAIHAYVAEKIDTVAVLRCLGASTSQVLAIYLVEAAAMGFMGALAGVALGVATQFALPSVVGDFMPVDVKPGLEAPALAFGLAVGVWVATLFALRPLLALRRVSPLQALRRDANELSRLVWWRDAPRILAASALVASVVLIALLRTASPRDGLAMIGAIGGALLVLWLSALALSYGARRLLNERWPFVVRQGVANLYRPGNQTRAIMLSLGFGAFLLSTLYLVQTNLLRHLSLSGEATRANLAFFDVQEDQAAKLDSIVRSSGLQVLQRVPIVPMRIAEIDGRTVSEIIGDTSRRGGAMWALRREYRSTYRDSIVPSEKLIQGEWFSEARVTDGAAAEVSFEHEIATDLGIGLGDTVVWDVQGVRVPTRVTSLRQVNWARFEPNFFAVFQPGSLESAPKSFVLLSGSDDAAARARLQRTVVDRFANISSIDLSVIQETVERILSKVSLAIRFMALFSVATGALVLFSAVAATRRQRIREGVLLKTLGATRHQIARIMLSEYSVLGALGAVTGMVLSVGGAWAVMRFIFELPFAPAVTPLIVIAASMMMLTMVIGLMSGRRVFAETPMAALREV